MQTSATEVSLHQLQAPAQSGVCGLQHLGCAPWLLWESGAWELAHFTGLALWYLLSQFTWQGTCSGDSACEPCLQLEWEAAPGLCKQKIQKEKNPHVSSWHSSSLRLLELLFTPSPARDEVTEWLAFLPSLECASPRGLSGYLCSSTNVLMPWLCCHTTQRNPGCALVPCAPLLNCHHLPSLMEGNRSRAVPWKQGNAPELEGRWFKNFLG